MRPEILIEKLLKDQLSMEELQELLADLGQEEMDPKYSVILERHFNNLVNGKNGIHLSDHDQPSDEK